MRKIAVAVHDICPDSYVRSADLRAWLGDRGIDRATLLVVPAPRSHPFFQQRPDLASWLRIRRAGGDAIGQLGLLNVPRPGRAGEFGGLGAADVAARIERGRELLQYAELPPQGFVAPGYEDTFRIWRHVARRYEWWAGRLRLHAGAARRRIPAYGLHVPLGVRGPILTGLLPAAARGAGEVLRLDVHPRDLDVPARRAALERVLHDAADRVPVTYDELARDLAPAGRPARAIAA